MMLRLKFITFAILQFSMILFGLQACNTIPKEKLVQAELDFDYQIENDSLHVDLVNSLHCPILTDVRSADPVLDEKLNEFFPKYLDAKQEYSTSYALESASENPKLNYLFNLGNANLDVALKDIELPFPKGKSYRILQAHNGSHSHSTNYSRYAIDFNLAIGDTVNVAANGYIVGVIEAYKKGGRDEKWRDYANFITVYHPQTNFFTQYVHLDYQGALVSVGDFVKAGDPIGISGYTGWADGEHLHFNVLKRTKDGFTSIPLDFVEGYKGSMLNKGDKVVKK